jgi:RNA polymerase sigma-70 factor (ECF subfamily)
VNAVNVDADLAVRITRDDRRAVAEEELCRRFLGRVRAYGRRHLDDAVQIDDFAHDVLVTVLESIRAGRLNDPERVTGYVFGTCRLRLHEWRRSRRRERSIRASLPDVRDAAVAPAALIDKERLARCLGELPMRDRMVVLLTFYADRDGDEIARELRISAGNVRVIRHRALAHLSEAFEADTSPGGARAARPLRQKAHRRLSELWADSLRA